MRLVIPVPRPIRWAGISIATQGCVVKAVKASGGTVVTREFTSDKATDFAAILTKLKAAKPDVIVYSGMDTQGGR